MKFLCIECDHVMDFSDRAIPGDGTMAAVFTCGSCGREVAMLANPMETQLVSSLGVKVGGREVPEQPMELTRSSVAEGRDDAFVDGDVEGAEDADVAEVAEPGADGTGSPAAPGASRTSAHTVTWSDAALERLGNVPSFVRGMVKRIYTDFARERGIPEITPAVMDRARTELGLEGM